MSRRNGTFLTYSNVRYLCSSSPYCLPAFDSYKLHSWNITLWNSCVLLVVSASVFAHNCFQSNFIVTDCGRKTHPETSKNHIQLASVYPPSRRLLPIKWVGIPYHSENLEFYFICLIEYFCRFRFATFALRIAHFIIWRFIIY